MDYTKVWVRVKGSGKVFYAGQTNNPDTARFLAHQRIKSIMGLRTYTYWGHYRWNGAVLRKGWVYISQDVNLPI